MAEPQASLRPAGTEDEATLPEAVERVGTAMLDVLSKRIDLLEHDLRSWANGVGRQVGGSVAVGLLLFLAWLAMNVAIHDGLATRIEPPLPWLAVAGLNLAVAGIVRTLTRRRES